MLTLRSIMGRSFRRPLSPEHMPPVVLPVLLLCLLAAPVSAQWRGYPPDSAEYRLVMRAGSPGGATGQVTFTHGAVLHAIPRGEDSLTVLVTLLSSDIAIGGEEHQRDSSRSAVEVAISRRGSQPDPGGLPGGPPAGSQVFARVFVAMAYPKRDALGQLVSVESDPDSMARLGMRSTMRRSTLPDTIVAGIRLSREVMEMSAESDSSISIRAGVSMPPMEMRVRAEQWCDGNWRVHRSIMRNQVRPRTGAAEAGSPPSVLANGVDMFTEFERLPARPR